MSLKTISEEPELVPCLFCDLSLVFPTGKDDYLAHLFIEHRLVIADVQVIIYFCFVWINHPNKTHLTGHKITVWVFKVLDKGIWRPSNHGILHNNTTRQDARRKTKSKRKILSAEWYCGGRSSNTPKCWNKIPESCPDASSIREKRWELRKRLPLLSWYR